MHQKMRKGCIDDYIKAFGAVYWGKKQQPPSVEERFISIVYITETNIRAFLQTISYISFDGNLTCDTHCDN